MLSITANLSLIPANDSFIIAIVFFINSILSFKFSKGLCKLAIRLFIISNLSFNFAINVYKTANHFLINLLSYLKKDWHSFKLNLVAFKLQARNLLILGACCAKNRFYIRFYVLCYIYKATKFFIKYVVSGNTGVT